jgi:hypothetical protein
MGDSALSSARPWVQRAYSFLCRLIDEHDERGRAARENLQRRIAGEPPFPLANDNEDEVEVYWSDFADDLGSVARDFPEGNDRDAVMKAVDAILSWDDLPDGKRWTRLRDARSMMSALIEKRKPKPNASPIVHANEKRDEWIYGQAFKGTPWQTIKNQLAKKTRWRGLESIPGLRGAVHRYAQRLGLLPIPARKSGRPIAKK